MEKKNNYIQLRVSDREKLILQEEAESRYMKMTEMLLKPFKKLLKPNTRRRYDENETKQLTTKKEETIFYTNADDYLAYLKDFKEQNNRTQLEDEQVLTDVNRASRVGVSDD